MFRTGLTIAVLSMFFVSGCKVPYYRADYSQAGYYERLTPYYSNFLYLTPRVRLRAVRELVGVPITFEDGSSGHADVFRSDIELFFARRVQDKLERLAVSREAIQITCPKTNLESLEKALAHSSDTYLVFHNVPCVGFAK